MVIGKLVLNLAFVIRTYSASNLNRFGGVAITIAAGQYHRAVGRGPVLNSDYSSARTTRVV
jgi:hypothetical protein